MRAAWVRPGGGRIPDGEKAKRHGIDTLYWSANDPELTGKLLDEMRKYMKVGIMRDPKWSSGDSPVKLALDVHDDLERLGSSSKQCFVIFDIEELWRRDGNYLASWLQAWRKCRPTRITYLTVEPMQGGILPHDFTDMVNRDPNLIVLPQCYYGPAAWNNNTDMTPAVESQVAMNVQAAGVRWERVKMFYGPKNLPTAWDGIVFGLADLG